MQERVERVLGVRLCMGTRCWCWARGDAGCSRTTGEIAELFQIALAGRFRGAFTHVVFAVLDSSGQDPRRIRAGIRASGAEGETNAPALKTIWEASGILGEVARRPTSTRRRWRPSRRLRPSSQCQVARFLHAELAGLPFSERALKPTVCGCESRWDPEPKRASK